MRRQPALSRRAGFTAKQAKMPFAPARLNHISDFIIARS